MKKLLQNRKGETLIETLFAFIILATIMIAFPLLIVSVNKLNAAVKENNISFNANSGKVKELDVEVTLTDLSDITPTVYTFTGVKGYIEEEDGFYYYEMPNE